jgi:predicted GH43/DUF377 family glycosyl hydrolase
VETVDPETRHVVYRLGALLADLQDPTHVLARCPRFIMEPEAHYEHVGLYIPHVVFPTGAVVVDGRLHIYYGCCDTVIGLATVDLDDLVGHVLETGGMAGGEA